MSRLVGSGELDFRGYLLCFLVVFAVAGTLHDHLAASASIRVLKSYA